MLPVDLAGAWKGTKELGLSKMISIHSRGRFGTPPMFLSTSHLDLNYVMVN